MLIKTAATLAALVVSAAAPAASMSFQGVLAVDNPNDVALIQFETSASAALDAQTWSFGGGVNAAGQAIAAGGFDTYISLFVGWGGGATFLASNDDGLCPPGTAAPVCADSTLHLSALPAGRYTLAISQPANFSFAENQGSGTLGDGFIGLAGSWSGSTAYAVDIASTALVPEPAAALLLALGLLALRLKRRD